jgi:hypothetical protein
MCVHRSGWQGQGCFRFLGGLSAGDLHPNQDLPLPKQGQVMNILGPYLSLALSSPHKKAGKKAGTKKAGTGYEYPIRRAKRPSTASENAGGS